MASGSAFPLGLSVTGELRGGRVEEGRPRSGGDGGKWPDRFIVSVAAGDDVFRIEAPDRESVDDVIPGAQQGDTVTLPVSVRAARGFVFYVLRGTAITPDDLTW